MPKTLEFFFDVVSPASYLAWTQIPGIVEKTGANVIYRPMFLPGVFEKAGSESPITVPAKGKWVFEDFVRHASLYNVPFQMNRKFPQSSVYAMRGLNAYREQPEFKALGDGFFNAMWVNDQDINDPEIVEKLVLNADIDIAEYLKKMSDPEVKKSLFDVTDEAVSRGVFGAPTFFIGETMHWGQDRLNFVEEDLLR